MKSRFFYITAGFSTLILLFTFLLFYSAGYNLTVFFRPLDKKLQARSYNYELLHLAGYESMEMSEAYITLREGLVLENGARLSLTDCTVYLDTHYNDLAVLELYDNSSLILKNCTILTADNSTHSIKLSDIAVLKTEKVSAPGLKCELYGNNYIKLNLTDLPLYIHSSSEPTVYLKGCTVPYISRALPTGTFKTTPPENPYIRHYSSNVLGKMVIIDSTVEKFGFLIQEETHLQARNSSNLSLTCVFQNPDTRIAISGIKLNTMLETVSISQGTISIELQETYLKEFSVIAENTSHIYIEKSDLTYIETRHESFIELENSTFAFGETRDESAIALYDCDTDADITIHDESSLFLENSSIFAYSFQNRRNSFYIIVDGERKRN